MDIFDASERYIKEKRSLIILAGKEYGCGSSRDWAAKGPWMQVRSSVTHPMWCFYKIKGSESNDSRNFHVLQNVFRFIQFLISYFSQRVSKRWSRKATSASTEVIWLVWELLLSSINKVIQRKVLVWPEKNLSVSSSHKPWKLELWLLSRFVCTPSVSIRSFEIQILPHGKNWFISGGRGSISSFCYKKLKFGKFPGLNSLWLLVLKILPKTFFILQRYNAKVLIGIEVLLFPVYSTVSHKSYNQNFNFIPGRRRPLVPSEDTFWHWSWICLLQEWWHLELYDPQNCSIKGISSFFKNKMFKPFLTSKLVLSWW